MKTKNLLLIFSGVFLTKILFTYIFKGTTLIPDSTCILKTAQYFANNFQLESCNSITGNQFGTPPILTTIIFSPLYFLENSYLAFKLILIFQSLLATSLFIPIYYFLKKIISKPKITVILSILILFIPAIHIYQYDTLSENLFLVASIFTLYFYSIYLETKKQSCLIFTILLAVSAIFLRPFGIITLIALLTNEVFRTKRSPTTYLLLALAIIPLFLTPFLLKSDLLPGMLAKISELSGTLKTLKSLTINLFHQFGSFIVATNSFLIFFFLLSLKNPLLKNIRIFLITLVTMNFLISADRLFWYNQDFHQAIQISTRYINLSLVLITIFGIGQALNIKKITNNFWSNLLIATLIIPVFFISTSPYRIAFALDFSHVKNLLPFFFPKIQIAITIILGLILLNYKHKIFAIFSLAILIFHSLLWTYDAGSFSQKTFGNDEITRNFQSQNAKILYLQDLDKPYINISYFSLISFTNNQVRTLYYLSSDTKGEKTFPTLYDYTNSHAASSKNIVTANPADYDYLVTAAELDLPVKFAAKQHEGETLKVYEY